MKNKKIKQKYDDEEVYINIDKTVDDLLNCWNSKMQYQNYMKRLDAMILGVERDDEILRKDNEYIESPDIRIRSKFPNFINLDTNLDNYNLKSKSTFDENLFKSSMQKQGKNDFLRDSQPLTKRDLHNSSSIPRLNDIMSQDDNISQHSYDSRINDSRINDRSNFNMVSKNKQEYNYNANSKNERYSQMSQNNQIK